MLTKEKFRFLSNYTIASYLVLGTVLISILNIFLHGLVDLPDFLLAVFILILRYVSFVLIKRRFYWSKYLIIILLIRSIYRLIQVIELPGANGFYIAMLFLQILLTLAASYLLFRPRRTVTV